MNEKEEEGQGKSELERVRAITHVCAVLLLWTDSKKATTLHQGTEREREKERERERERERAND